jgi:hypothetical protein
MDLLSSASLSESVTSTRAVFRRLKRAQFGGAFLFPMESRSPCCSTRSIPIGGITKEKQLHFLDLTERLFGLKNQTSPSPTKCRPQPNGTRASCRDLASDRHGLVPRQKDADPRARTSDSGISEEAARGKSHGRAHKWFVARPGSPGKRLGLLSAARSHLSGFNRGLECLKGIADFLNFMRRYKPVLFWWLGRGQLCDSGRSFQKNLAEGVVFVGRRSKKPRSDISSAGKTRRKVGRVPRWPWKDRDRKDQVLER